MLNGAAARLVKPGDIVIVISYRDVQEEDVATHNPRLVYVDKQNKITRTAHGMHSPAAV